MRLLAAFTCAALLVSGCGLLGDKESDKAEPDAPKVEQIALSSLKVDWPAVGDDLEPSAPPEVPEGFDQERYDEMVDTLTTWAEATTIDPEIRRSDTPAVDVAADLPDDVGAQIEKLTEGRTSPRLAVANVFADDVEVIGDPLVSTAWKADSVEQDGAPALNLQLQTRAAYQVRVGKGPERVVAVLRVHELVTRTGETGDLGVGYSWQEFGASDCVLAVEDALRPDDDATTARQDLDRFVDASKGDTLKMPKLAEDEVVDEEYLARCKAGAV